MSKYGEPWEPGECTTDGRKSKCTLLIRGKAAVRCTPAGEDDDLIGGGPIADRILACVNACAGHDAADVARGLKLLRTMRELRAQGNLDGISAVRLHAAENHP